MSQLEEALGDLASVRKGKTIKHILFLLFVGLLYGAPVLMLIGGLLSTGGEHHSLGPDWADENIL